MALKKLVRDRIPDIISEDTGEIVHTIVLDREEYRHELKWKLLEEVREACGAPTPANFLKELADLQELIDTNLKEWGFTREALIAEQAAKRESKGGFDLRQFIIRTEQP
jgi:predicted house-cleaning noncanonical NTP pyrophosphatase (MazG superfamily)